MTESAPGIAELKPRLLFVDDDPSILNSLRVVFRNHYDVSVTTDGYEAIELLRTRAFDVIVSDQRMPDITGVQLLRQACKLAPNTVRILLTGYSDTDAMLSAINEVEVHRFLQKPWDNKELKRVMDEAIDLAATLSRAAPLEMDDREMAGVAPRGDEKAGEKETVLVVSSKKTLYAQIADGLAGCVNCDISLVHASGVLDVFQALERLPINIIVCSFDMQSEGDRTFIQILKREHPYILVIAVCDSTDSIRLVELINQARIFRFVRTPVNTTLLARYIESAVRHAAELRTNPVLVRSQQPENLPDEMAKSSAVQFLQQHFALVNLSQAARWSNFFRFFRRN